ncbi:E3 ubiquitin- ligase Praja-2-like isoform X1 [Olea europaea subsp. europaea]|uniref:RING-type E3 ubiquitin transferase n=1 Tax=Olea europaea subsp. europaea TaxID=158383 RepID=A0A8S0VDX4_OLEEU|nr:E3 ubiquitin- ligase Praja-2-like isoform X1 [Olea europaea subsp. europaea]
MAEDADLHRFHHREPPTQSQQQPPPLRSVPRNTPRVHQEQENRYDEFYRQGSILFDFDSLELPSNSNFSFFIPDEYNTTTDFRFDFNAEPESWGRGSADSLPCRNRCVSGEVEYDEPMNFVAELFESRESHVLNDPIWEFDSGLAEDLGMEFGFGPGLGSDTDPPAMAVGVVGANLESNSGETELNSWFIVDDEGVNDFRITENEREELQWQEVDERIQIHERENFDSVIDRIGEILVSSNVPSPEGENSFSDEAEDDEEGENYVQWEVLMTVNNLEEHNNGSEVARSDLSDDYIMTTEQLVENEDAVKFGHPASKSVVENLPSIELTVDKVREKNDAVVCAVCKENVAVGEKMTRMPCFHLYHGDCILPWLEIRNTCPVCRYELPTDNADYE